MGVAGLNLQRSLTTFALLALLPSPLSSFTNCQSDSAADSRKWEVSIEGGRGGIAWGWKERYSIRAGIGHEILHSIWGHVYLEYRRYNSEPAWGEHWKQVFVRSYPRTDVASYLSFTVLGCFQLGVGAVAQFHEDMLYRHSWGWSPPNPPYDTLRAIRGLKLILVGGIKYDIPLWYDFYAPVGLFISHSSLSPMYLTLRAGISKRF